MMSVNSFLPPPIMVLREKVEMNDHPIPPPPPMPHEGQECSISNLVSAVQFGDLPFVRNAVTSSKEWATVNDDGGCSLLHWAAINNRRAITHLLIQHGAQVNYCGGKLQEIPLQWAIRNDKFTGMAQYLIEAGSDLSHRSANGLDALHVACRMGNINMAYLILSAGANPNTVDGQGNSILQFLLKTQAEWDSFEMQRLLLSCGASITQVDAEGNNALHLMAAAGKQFTDGRLALLYVNTLKTNEAIRKAFVQVNKDGFTVYQVAVQVKNSTFINFYIDLHLRMLMPRFLPTVASSLCTASPFIAIYLFGWSWITPLVAIASIGILQKLTLGSISSSRTGFAWGTIATCEASYFMNVAHHYDIVINTIVVVIGVSICYTLYRSTVTQTVCLARDADRKGLVEAVALAGLVEGPTADAAAGINETAAALGMAPASPVHVPRLCTTCLTDKTKATMHCSRCNICVVSLDHHCPFVDNCVGKGNRRVFVFFTFIASFGCMFNAILSWIAQFIYECPKFGTTLTAFPLVQGCVAYNNPFYFVAPWLALLTSMWIFVLFFHQVWMVAASTTTYDLVKGMHDGKNQSSLQASLRNLSEFFATGHFNVQQRPRKKRSTECKSCPPNHNHNHAHGHASSSTATFPSADTSSGGGTDHDQGGASDISSSSRDIASFAANTMSSISASVAPMILGETETENVPLLGDDGAEGGEFTGDAEEGSFLGSKNKVSAAVVTSSESDGNRLPLPGGHNHSRPTAAAVGSNGGGAYTLMAMAQQSQFMRRLFFASTSGSSPGEKKKDDDGDIATVASTGSAKDSLSSSTGSTGSQGQAHYRTNGGGSNLSRSSSGSAV